MRGCGFGILFAAIVLMIAFHSKNNSLDNEKIMERASELGMVMPKETESHKEAVHPDTQQNAAIDSDADTEKVKPQSTQQRDASSSENEKDNIKQDNSEKTDSSKKDSSKKDSSKKENSKKKDDSPDADEEVDITIKRGEVCRQIAQDLYKLGMVEDAETFRKFMQEKNYDNMIRVGTFKLKRGMTQEEIAQSIISQD